MCVRVCVCKSGSVVKEEAGQEHTSALDEITEEICWTTVSLLHRELEHDELWVNLS